MPPAGWLLAAALVLVLIASWCGGAQAALARVAAGGNAQYSSLLMLMRACAEAAAAVLVTLAFTHWLGAGGETFLAAAAVVLVASYVLIGVGPRAIGRKRAERVSATTTRLLRPVVRLLGPLSGLLTNVTESLPLGGHSADGELNGRPELLGLADLIEGRAEIEPGEREMVRSVFELGDTIVREVMVPRTDMVWVERDKTVGEALSLALLSGFSRIPVVGDSTDDVVGIAYLKDMVAWEHDTGD